MTKVERSSGLEVTWAPGSRVAFMRPRPLQGGGTGKAADELVRSLRSWTTGQETFALLIDARLLDNVDAEFRAKIYAYVDTERDRLRIAWFGATPHVQAMIKMFMRAVQATGPSMGETFTNEEDARIWLRSEGFHA
ncbi:MAG: hypothetical protein JWO69_1137 [Thermoleophilia bacterium]|nr:hypothetical protein [Thermoleophilia bacterium]